jgi:protein KTI12
VDKAREVNEARLKKREAEASKSADKEEATPSATTSCDTIVDSTEPYEPGNWDNLVFRYEEPNPMTRWDSPLFTLIWEDDEAQTNKVFSDLWDAIAGEARKVVRPNQATIQRGREESGDYLYLLDRETSDVVKRIVEAQREGDDVDEVRIPSGSVELTIHLPAGNKVGLPQLQRLRRAFMGLNRGGIGLEAVGDMKSSRLRDTFVTYLNDSFEKDE